ncbi:hemerythrin domain-containing protein [Serinicoccus sediminis]|uniref:hemerythrin domain-containing protein n=1 Tax=Serinicoccus sediminis TaxID=2306021 RepID=UPI00101F9133|nr:hemerythrin domain-containing protein [Serinicoccus sediminis]
MAEGESARLVAWSVEMRAVHDRLREALRVTREAVDDGGPAPDATRDLLMFCRGFCAALTQHHEGEDRHLFPAIAAAHPHLGQTLRALQQDHSMIAHLLTELQHAVDHRSGPAELVRHLDGIDAVMESHFGYEERQLLGVLQSLDLQADVRSVLGPL